MCYLILSHKIFADFLPCIFCTIQASLHDLHRVLPILVGRYHAVRIEKDKLHKSILGLAKDLKKHAGKQTHWSICKANQLSARLVANRYVPPLFSVRTALKSDFANLERAHLSQGAFIQALQNKITKVDSYKTTIKVSISHMSAYQRSE